MLFASIFTELELPNTTTWFYASALLAVALFFKFSRNFSLRNLDVLTLYLFAPGLLLLEEAGRDAASDRNKLMGFLGYVWLLATSLYFLLRCLADLAIVRRPSLNANLNRSGLGWLAGALFIGLVAVAARQPERLPPTNDSPLATDTVPKISEQVSKSIAPDADASQRRVWVERALAVLCHLSVIVGMMLIGWRHYNDLQAGMSAATFYLLLPYTFLLLPDSSVGVGRWDHAWPMALVVWTIFAYRRPVVAGALLGLAAGTAPILVFILPTWLSFYRNRGLGRFLGAFLLMAIWGVAVLGVLVWMSDGQPPSRLLPDWLRLDWWQTWLHPTGESRGVWRQVHPAYRAPVLIASLALVITSSFWPNTKNLAHVLALSAAALLAVQFWYADGGVYVMWYLPLLLLLVFRPNLQAHEPPPVVTDDWLARLWRHLVERTLRWVRWRKPVAVETGPKE